MAERGGAFGIACFVMLALLLAVESRCEKRPVVFNFGDSNSDTGGLMVALGYPIGLPYGRLFFRRSTGRLCDGRLVIDFLCQSAGMKYLSPYLQALGSDFSYGANFAIAGSATQPRNRPFSLFIQTLQFVRFKARSLELVQELKNSSHVPHLIDVDGFNNALYTFDIGQNDLSAAFSANLRYQQVLERIPSILEEIKGAIKTVYEQGGRNFWVHNTGPLGCLPQTLSLNKHLPKDQYGCIQSYNDAAKAFNYGLLAACQVLRSELNGATIVHVDIYNIKYDLIANSAKHGFKYPLMACCGYGGPPYNYHVNITCGNPPSQACSLGTRHISWDGVHYTEAANAIVASRILSAKFSEPPLGFDYFCHTRS